MSLPLPPSLLTETAIVLLGHGSRDPQWRVPMETLAARISQGHPDVVVRCAFLEWASPDVTSAVDELIAQGHVRIRLLPLFFGMGKHAREDLPELVKELREQHPELHLSVLPSAGEQAAVIDVLARLVLDADTPHTS